MEPASGDGAGRPAGGPEVGVAVRGVPVRRAKEPGRSRFSRRDNPSPRISSPKAVDAGEDGMHVDQRRRLAEGRVEGGRRTKRAGTAYLGPRRR